MEIPVMGTGLMEMYGDLADKCEISRYEIQR